MCLWMVICLFVIRDWFDGGDLFVCDRRFVSLAVDGDLFSVVVDLFFCG